MLTVKLLLVRFYLSIVKRKKFFYKYLVFILMNVMCKPTYTCTHTLDLEVYITSPPLYHGSHLQPLRFRIFLWGFYWGPFPIGCWVDPNTIF